MLGTVFIIFCLFAANCVLAQVDTVAKVYYEGDTCLHFESKLSGKCKRISKCESARDEVILHGKIPQTCSFVNLEQIVCCPETRSRISPDDSENEIVDTRLQAMEKSRRKCEQYGNVLSPVTSSPPITRTSRHQEDVLLFRMTRNQPNVTREELDPRISGGTQAIYREFPHMAAIGYGEQDEILWGCGGSLISEQYILTAGHCLQQRERGVARWVRIGRTNLDSIDTRDSIPQQFEIIARIPHPDYQQRVYYNDLALLKLHKPANLNDNVRPACLHTDDVPIGKVCIATGWGKVDENDRGSRDLMKVNLRVESPTVCDTEFEPLFTQTKKLKSGFSSDTMICAGDPSKKDTCQGDSGGPIQIKLKFPPGMHSVIGITSFGVGLCGSVSAGAVYTRVSYYLPWIVDTIWPTK